ncbi:MULTISPECIES: alpha/beta fold hydrolase [Nocardiaceae]|uniref:alpha/beta fold hydrolase n=1 Tax=Nocardiaceae TaxID=85025 RepID=UPI00344270E1
MRRETTDLDSFVLVGDSFGAAVALEFATRLPAGLVGLVLSGGFASDPLPWWKRTAGCAAARWAVGPVYHELTLRFHAWQLASRFDRTAEVPHSGAQFRQFFVDNTPKASFDARVRAVSGLDLRRGLPLIEVPTLVITPEDDKLVGRTEADTLVELIPRCEERVLPATGHMFRFTHPTLYGQAITQFVDEVTERMPT